MKVTVEIELGQLKEKATTHITNLTVPCKCCGRFDVIEVNQKMAMDALQIVVERILTSKK